MATNRPTRTTAYTIMGEIAAKRKTMVSTGDRSAKIRTYNYPPPRPHHRPPHQLHHLQPARLYEWRHSGLHRPPDCGRKCREAQRERVGLVQHSASLFNRNSWDINTKRPLPKLGRGLFVWCGCATNLPRGCQSSHARSGSHGASTRRLHRHGTSPLPSGPKCRMLGWSASQSVRAEWRSSLRG